MAFPSVRSSIVTDGTAASATPAINLPATVQQNDVLFVAFRVAVAGAIGWPTGWENEMFDLSSDAADDQMAVAWKRAEGNESGTQITLSCTSGKFAAVAYAIQGSADPHVRAPELSTVATGTGDPDATTCTPTGGAKDYLWLTFTGREGEATLPPTYPTNYSVSQLTATSGMASTVGTNVRVSAAVRTNNNAASEDAGAWNFSDSEDWTAYTIAFHPTPDDPAPGHARTGPPRLVSRLAVAAAIGFAFVPVLEAAAPDGAATFTTPPRVVQPQRLILSELVTPWSGQPGGAADAASTDTGPQVYPRGAVQFTPIAGPVVTGSELSWLSAPPGLASRSVTIRSEYAAPLTTQEDVSIGWLPRSAEAVRASQGVRSFIADPPIAETLPPEADAVSTATGPMVWPRGTVQYQAVGGPVVTGSELSWLSTPPGSVPRVVTIRSELAAPVQQDEISLGWLPRAADLVRRETRPPSVIVLPGIATEAAAFDVQWWPNSGRVVQRIPFVQPFTADPPVYSLLPSDADALSPATGPMVWPRGVVQYVAIAGPVLVPSAEADLGRPLSFNDDGIIRPDRYTHYQAVSGPVVIPLETGWLAGPGRIVPRVRLPLGAVRAVPISPLDAAGRSDLPWLMPQLQLVRGIPQTRHQSAAPVQFTLGEGAPQIPWLVRGLPPVIAKFPTRHVLALPVSATAGDRSDIPWLRPFLLNVLPVFPVRHGLALVPAVPADQIDIPWLRPVLPLVLATHPTRHQLALPPVLGNALPWLRQQVPLVIGTQPTRHIHAKPVVVESVDLPWLMRGLAPVLAKFPTMHVLVLPVSATAGDLSNIPWNRQQLPLVLAKQPTRHVLSVGGIFDFTGVKSTTRVAAVSLSATQVSAVVPDTLVIEAVY